MENIKKHLPPVIKPAFKRKPYDIYSITDYLKPYGISQVGYVGYDVYSLYGIKDQFERFLRGRDLIALCVSVMTQRPLQA